MSKEKKNRKRLWLADDSDEETEGGKAAKSTLKPPAKGADDDQEKSANLSPGEDSPGPVRRGRRNKQKDCARTEKVVSTWERAEERLLQQAMAASLQCTGADGGALPLPGKIFVTFIVRKNSGDSTVLEQVCAARVILPTRFSDILLFLETHAVPAQGDEEEIEVEVEASTTPETLAGIVTKELSKRAKGAGGSGAPVLSTRGKRLHFGTDWGYITEGKTLSAYDIRQGAALFCMVEDP
eukprot:3088454-Rhodomonas_salina.3